jgi:diguanylate cyclase (GGDEF)-like protein
VKEERYVPATEAKILSIAEAISCDTSFRPNPNPYCNWCDYNIICPAMGVGLDAAESASELESADSFKKFISRLEIMRNDLYAINKANAELAGILEKSLLVSKIVEVLVETARVEKGFLYFNDESGSYRIAASKNLSETANTEIRSAITVKGPTIINDLKAGPAGAAITAIVPDAVHALALPLIVREREYGTVVLLNKKNHLEFNNYDLIMLSNIANIAAISYHNAELYELAIKDGLTKLFVHSYFQNRMETELLRAARYGSCISLLMIDIDHFKSINDRYGHPEGDIVLKKFAKIISDSVRKVDIAARYGGEEFAVILPETDLPGAEKVAENLRMLIERENFPLASGPLNVTASIGVASWNKKDGKMAFINKADIALYRAKAEGRNRVCKHTG